MTKINRKALDATQLQYLALAEELQENLISCGFMATRIEKAPDDRCTFHVIFFDGTYDYRIYRDYRGNVNVVRHEYKNYPNVSSSTRGEVWKRQKDTGNVKVITAKKIQAKIDAENAYHAEMQTLDAAAIDKAAAFIAEVQALEEQGVTVKWQHERTHDDTQGKVSGGYIERGGLEYSFEISQDGYISKEMRVSYVPETTLEVFMQLSDNKYTA